MLWFSCMWAFIYSQTSSLALGTAICLLVQALGWICDLKDNHCPQRIIPSQVWDSLAFSLVPWWVLYLSFLVKSCDGLLPYWYCCTIKTLHCVFTFSFSWAFLCAIAERLCFYGHYRRIDLMTHKTVAVFDVMYLCVYIYLLPFVLQLGDGSAVHRSDEPASFLVCNVFSYSCTDKITFPELEPVLCFLRL